MTRTETACPRCGYDLQGVIASWEDACPMQGVCAECGLEYSWAEVMCPDKFEPRWCVEFKSRSLSFVRKAFKTFAKSLRPWSFWRDLKMSNDIHWLRLILYLVLVLLLPLLAGHTFKQTAAAIRVRWMIQKEVLRQHQSTLQSLPRVTQNLQDLRKIESDPNKQQALDAQLKMFQADATAPDTITLSYGEAILEAVLYPTRGTSAGRINSAYGAYPYPAPNQLSSYGWSRQTWYGNRVLIDPNAHLLALLAQGALFIGLPLGFILLPFSRMKANVRWAHIARVSLYSLFLPVVAMMLIFALILTAIALGSTPRWIEWLARMSLIHFTWFGLLIWWTFAIRSYLKIPHAWVTAPILALLTYLLLLSFLFLTFPWIVINV
ncbi:MAG: hypothetical protein O7G85_08695 [Planctomycetota bacterium]|nr:hypothetical protein [Planctomycetota bacterium]